MSPVSATLEIAVLGNGNARRSRDVRESFCLEAGIYIVELSRSFKCDFGDKKRWSVSGTLALDVVGRLLHHSTKHNPNILLGTHSSDEYTKSICLHMIMRIATSSRAAEQVSQRCLVCRF